MKPLFFQDRTNLNLNGIKFFLPKICNEEFEKEISINILINILKIFLPYTTRQVTKRGRTYYEFEGFIDSNQLICVNLMNRLFGETKVYIQEGHLFQILCEESMNEVQRFTPKEIREVAEFHLENCKFLFILQNSKTNLQKFNFCFNYMFNSGDKNENQ